MRPPSSARASEVHPSTDASSLPLTFPLTDLVDKINKKDLIVEEDSTIEAFETVDDLADDLPSNSPRFIVVSYQLTHPDGRTSTPLFLLNWNPSSGSPDMKTLHASGLSLFQRTADVARVSVSPSSSRLERLVGS